MLRAVVADLHLGQASDDLERFAALVARIEAAHPGELVLLGDLFWALVGFPRFWDETVKAGLALLRGLRDGGVRVVLVEGNRDFFLDASALDPYRDRAAMAHSFAAGGRRFLLEHGDLVNRADRAYHAWRGLSKSGVARAFAQWIPRRIATRIVSSTEARLAQTNFSYRRTLPVADLERAAHGYFRSGVDVVLWGHFHRAWSLSEGGREARALPAWAETGAVTWISERGELETEETAPP